MALDVEGVVDGGVGREKPLRRSSQFETLHASFPLSDWQVRVLCSVVLPATTVMEPGKAQILQSSTIRWQFVCDNGIWDKTLLLQQSAHQFERRFLVSACLDQDIQHFAFTIDSAPQIHSLAGDGHEHLIKVPPVVWSRAHCPQSPGIGLPELQCPAPHRFIRNINATFSEKIFDVPVAEGKPEIQPDSVLNDHRWKSVSGIGDILHPATLLRLQKQITLLM